MSKLNLNETTSIDIKKTNALLQAISRAQEHFISHTAPNFLFEGLLNDFIQLTHSEYGFIGEVLYKPDGELYLKTHAISNTTWDDKSREFYNNNAPSGLEFTNLNTLFGAVIVTGEPVISNNPADDSRRGGWPEGHPTLNAFLGIPVYCGEKLTGMISVANCPSGYSSSNVEFLQPLLKTYGQIIHAFNANIACAETEHKLIESEKRFRAYVENSSDAMYLLDTDGNIFDINQEACSSLGYSREELLTLSLFDISRTASRDKLNRAMNNLNSGKPFRIEGIHYRKDKREFPVEVTIGRIETDSKTLLLACARNISERKKAEQTLQSNSHSFDLIKSYITLTTGLSQSDIIQSTLKFLTDKLGIKYSTIVLIEPDNTKITLSAINEESDLSLATGDTIALSETVLTEILNNKTPLYRPDISSAKQKHTFDEILTGQGLRSDLIVPLCIEDQCLGTLCVGSTEIDGVSAEARQVVTLLAPSLAHSLQNSKLFNTMESSEAKYRRLVEVLREDYYFYAHDTNGIFTYLSPSIKNVLGYSPVEFLSHLTTHHTDDPINLGVQRHTELSLKGVSQPPYEVEVFHKDGATHRLEVTEVPVFDENNNVIAVEGIAHDITGRKQAAQALRRMNRTLSTILQINHAMVRSKDEINLLQTACEVLVKTGGHRLTWVGFAENNAEKSVKPVAHAGHNNGYLNSIQISWADNSYGHGPTGTAIRSGEPCIARDIHNDPDYEPWSKDAEKQGYASSVSLPLINNGETFGALNIYSTEADAFDPSETRLLEDLANELAYGIRAIRISAERDRAERKLRASEENYRAIFNTTNDAIFIHDTNTGAIIDVNHKFTEMYGYTADEAKSLDMDAFSAETTDHKKEDALRWMKKAVAGEPQLFEWHAKNKSGRTFWVEVNLKCVTIGGHDRLLATVRDISDRKQSVIALRESEAFLSKAQQIAHIGHWKLDPKTHQVTGSDELFRIFGLNRDETTLEAFVGVVHPEDRENDVAAIRRGIEQGENWKIEHRLICKDSAEKWVQAIGEVITDDSGKIQHLVGTVQDISERKRAEQIIQDQARHQKYIGRISELCLKSNLNDMLGSVLEEMLSIFRCDRAWFLTPCDPDAPYWHVPIERTRPEWPGACGNGTNTPMTSDMANLLRTALNSNGAVRYDPESTHKLTHVADEFSVKSQMCISLHVKTGQPWLLGIHHCAQAYIFTQQEQQLLYDIAQRVTDALSSLLILRELSSSETSLAEAQRISKLGSWELDITNNNLTWSEEAYRIFELEPSEFGETYESFLNTVHPEDRELVDQTYRDSAKKKIPYDITHRLLLKNGQLKYVNEKCETHYDDNDIPLRSVGTVQDVTERVLTEEALRESEERWRSITNYSPDHIIMIDRDATILFINHVVPNLTHEEIIGTPIYNYLPADFKQIANECYQRVFNTGIPNRYETEHHDQEGNCSHFEASVGPVKGRDQIDALIIIALDITERKKSEEDSRQFAAVVENTAEAVLVTDANNKIIAINKAFTEITGYSEEETLGKDPSILKSDQHDRNFYMAMWTGLQTADLWQGEIWDRRKSGEIFPAWTTISVVRDNAGELINYVSVFSDISSIKRSQEQLDFLAHHDPLTKLPNRLLFNDRLDHALQHALREDNQVAVLFLDLDRFKNINDSLGHPVGDKLLQSAAERITNLLRKEDTVARLGGDEFIILIEEHDDAQVIAHLAQKIINSFSSPFLIDRHELHLTVSVGISLYPHDGEDSATLVKNADAAMYRAKEEGRNDYQFYTTSLTAAVFERLTLETALRQALLRNEFVLYFQAQHSLETGKIIGTEALIRWQHPDMGLILPAKFIPMAEESGLIEHIGEWVLYNACEQMQRWQAGGAIIERITANVSGVQFQRGDIVSTLKAVLDQTRLDPKLLELEITEGVIMQKTEHAISVLDNIKQLGVAIAVDDFGTGYSSLSYLKRLPVDKLKIDKSFVRDIPENPNDEAIARAVVALGHSLQLKVIAEGIETEEQLNFLQSIGCNEGQGFYYGTPLSAQEFEKLILTT